MYTVCQQFQYWWASLSVGKYFENARSSSCQIWSFCSFRFEKPPLFIRGNFEKQLYLYLSVYPYLYKDSQQFVRYLFSWPFWSGAFWPLGWRFTLFGPANGLFSFSPSSSTKCNTHHLGNRSEFSGIVALSLTSSASTASASRYPSR